MAAVTPLLRASLGNPSPAATPPQQEQQVADQLARYIRDAYEASKSHRQTSGLNDRLLAALRAVRGEYPDQTLRDIQQFGGSEVYARITATKVRGVAAYLREIYSSSARPWGIDPTPEPNLPGPPIGALVAEMLSAEVAETQAQGLPIDEAIVWQRKRTLTDMLQQARRKQAQDASHVRENQLDDILWEGGFYNALWDFLLDIATFPYACIKGPVVHFSSRVTWKDKAPVVERVPVMHWQRCSPFDVYFAPWAERPQDGYIIHQQRTTRAALQALIGLGSYDEGRIRMILDGMEGWSSDWCDYVESDRAELEQRLKAGDYRTGNAVDRPLPMLEFHGPISGKLLLEWGMTPEQVPDATQDVDVIAYLIHDTVIGVRTNPHPAGRKPFYVDSFERVPGSIYGHGIPDLIEDVQSVANATLRALVNNLSMGSGPMAWVNEDRLSPNDPGDKIHPWKIFRTTDSLTGDSSAPMQFFQPNTNAQELFGVFEKFAQMADELSSLPRYMQGNASGMGGVGRTASGLSMLMEAANRTIRQTVSSVDANVIEPVVSDLNIYLALTRPDLNVGGDIDVVAKGAAELLQRETLRMRRLEFLNITNNPVDLQLVGPGRGAILKEIARDLALPISEVLPGAAVMAMQPPAAPAAGGMPPQPGQMPQQAQGQPTPPTQGVARPMAPSPQP